MLVTIVFKLFLVVLVVLVVTVHGITVEEEFQEFMIKYQKSYSAAEYKKRLQIFEDSLKIAAELDDKDSHATYGVTKFSDLTREEFKRDYLIANFSSPKTRGEDYPVLPMSTLSPQQLPTAFDWNDKGVVTGVYNQGQCGSCWAFSTTENVESMWAIAGHGLENLSMQELVDCDTNDHGCGGGNPPVAYQYIIRAGGLDSYQSYPYVGTDQSCRFNPSAVAARIQNWGYITTNDNENEMQSWTYQYGPPSICVDAEEWQYYTGGVITSNCGTQMDHCVQLTGWSTVNGIPAWNVRNSWGTDWGYGGYLYVMRGADVCLIGNEVSSCVI